MKQSLSLVILIFNICIGYSQNILITGKTIDYETRQPMPYTSISIDSTISTTSDKDGNFYLRASKLKQTDTLKIRFLGCFNLNIINLPQDKDTIRFNEIPIFEYFIGNSTADYNCGLFDFKCKRAWKKHLKEENERINNYYLERNAEISRYHFLYDNLIYLINVTNHSISLKSDK
jgi:hypothetical protein